MIVADFVGNFFARYNHITEFSLPLYSYSCSGSQKNNECTIFKSCLSLQLREITYITSTHEPNSLC